MTKKSEKRKIMVILSNRFDKSAKPRYMDISCTSDGTILEEKRLRGKPREAIYDEVWVNDDNRKSVDECHNLKRIYRHPLEKPRKSSGMT